MSNDNYKLPRKPRPKHYKRHHPHIRTIRPAPQIGPTESVPMEGLPPPSLDQTDCQHRDRATPPTLRPFGERRRPTPNTSPLRPKEVSYHVRSVGSLLRGLTVLKPAPALPASWAKDAGLKIAYSNLRSSAIATWDECHRKFLFRERLGLVGRTYSPALYRGTILHGIFESLYSGGRIDNLTPVLAKYVDALRAELEPALDPDTGMLPNGKTLDGVLAAAGADSRIAAAMAMAYYRRHPIEQLMRGYHILGTEVPLAIHIRGLRSPVVILVDILLQNRKSGKLWLMDHKTTSQHPIHFASTLPFSTQARLYKWVTVECLRADPSIIKWGIKPDTAKDIEVGGFIHNVIMTQRIKQKKGQTFDEYLQEIQDKYEEGFTVNPMDPPILQSIVPHVGPYMDEELLVQLHEVDLASNGDLNLARYRRNDKACFKWNSPCPYLNLCRSPEVEWTTQIATTFKQEFRQTGFDDGADE